MNVDVILLFSVIAITGFYFCAHHFGLTKTANFTSLDDAVKLFLKRFDLGRLHSENIINSCLCNHERTALIQFDRQLGIGVIDSHGNKWVTTLIGHGSAQSIKHKNNSLHLELNNFAIPKLSLNFITSTDCIYWHNLLINYLNKNE